MKIDSSLSETPWSISNIAIPAPLCFFFISEPRRKLGIGGGALPHGTDAVTNRSILPSTVQNL
jgi:hypothetical protein